MIMISRLIELAVQMEDLESEQATRSVGILGVSSPAMSGCPCATRKAARYLDPYILTEMGQSEES